MQLIKNTVWIFAIITMVSCQKKASKETVTIGTQVWMTKNLEVSTFRNGDPIPQAQMDAAWERAKKNEQPAWCYYYNDGANVTKYGKLYNWYAVNDPRGLAPVGYHIPTDAEWTKLTSYLGGESVAGKKMKSKRGWANYGNGTNKSGFSGLPGGYREDNGRNSSVGYGGYWWSSTEQRTSTAWYYGMIDSYEDVHRYGNDKGFGYSVRCIKD